jgi:hypothetical protein
MSQPVGTTRLGNDPGGFATGVSYFAGTVLIVAGILQFLNGLAAVIKDQFYVQVNNYAYNIDTSSWGWIHLIIGVLAIVIGFGVFMNQSWAMTTALILAVLSLIANFLFIPYYPLWSLLVIALDVLVIWALSKIVTRTT